MDDVGLNVEYCRCEGELCNSAGYAKVSHSAFLATTISLFIFYST